MKNLSPFYYELTESSVNYTRNSQGAAPNIQRLVDSKPCWPTNTLMSNKKQKSLVLADWTASRWLPEKIEKVKQELGKLIDEGFLIYMWQDGRVVLMDKYHLSTLDNQVIRETMSLAYTEDIIKAAVTQNKLTHDQVQVLDDYWVNHVVSDKNEPGVRILRTSELSGLSPRKVEALIKILNASKPRLTKIIHDKFSSTACGNARILIKNKGDIVLEQDYRKIHFSEETIDSLLAEERKASVVGFDLTRDDLAKIEEINLRLVGISSEKLNFILKAADKLKKLIYVSAKA